MTNDLSSAIRQASICLSKEKLKTRALVAVVLDFYPDLRLDHTDQYRVLKELIDQGFGAEILNISSKETTKLCREKYVSKMEQLGYRRQLAEDVIMAYCIGIGAKYTPTRRNVQHQQKPQTTSNQLATQHSESPYHTNPVESASGSQLVYKLNEDRVSLSVVETTNKHITDLVIPATVMYKSRNYPVTCINNCAFSNCESLKSAQIPETITEIGSDAFFNCKCLTSINIPKSVSRIGQGAFSCCYNLQTISIYNYAPFANMCNKGRFEGVGYADIHGMIPNNKRLCISPCKLIISTDFYKFIKRLLGDKTNHLGSQFYNNDFYYWEGGFFSEPIIKP